MTRREEDFAKELFVCSSHDYVLFFTSLGRVYRLKGYEVPEGSRSSKGMNIANILPVTQDEKITAMIRVPQYEDGHYLVMVTRRGTVKRTALSQYGTVRKSGLIAIILEEGDELAEVMLTDGTAQIFCGTRSGAAIRFDENDAREMGRSAHGVRAIRLGPDDAVVGAAAVKQGDKILSISENGYGKRTEIAEYRLQNRGGKGITSYKVTEKTGPVAGIIPAHEDEDALVISSDGIIIRVHVADIPVYSRSTQGVRVMRIAEGAKVVTVAGVPHEDETAPDSDTGADESGVAEADAPAAGSGAEQPGEEEK
jgi:DNA gyrase subunit A